MKPIALVVLVGSVAIAAYLLLRAREAAATTPTIAPPIAPGHTTT